MYHLNSFLILNKLSVNIGKGMSSKFRTGSGSMNSVCADKSYSNRFVAWCPWKFTY